MHNTVKKKSILNFKHYFFTLYLQKIFFYQKKILKNIILLKSIYEKVSSVTEPGSSDPMPSNFWFIILIMAVVRGSELGLSSRAGVLRTPPPPRLYLGFSFTRGVPQIGDLSHIMTYINICFTSALNFQIFMKAYSYSSNGEI